MQYFVSVESSEETAEYFDWQLSILHNSLKKLGLQDNLLVAIAGEGSFPVKNKFNHKKKIKNQNP